MRRSALCRFRHFISHDEIGIHLGYFLRNQTELQRVCVVAFVVKCHRLKRQDRFAALFIGRLVFPSFTLLTISYGAAKLQPAGRVGPKTPPAKTLLCMYHSAV
jgi:hypothetical protein